MKSILFLVTTFVVSIGAFMPIENHVKWGYFVKRTSPTEATIYLRAKIDDGWHIYSQHIGGPIKTQFTFVQANSYKLIGKTTEPKVAAKFDKTSKMNITSFEKEAIFEQKIRIKKANEPVAIKVKLKFAACNAKSCLPPDEATFNIAVPAK